MKDIRRPMLPSDCESVQIEPYLGPRFELLPLFAQADDSPTQINSYLESGEVLVARRTEKIVGHVQLISATFDWEIKSLTVLEEHRSQGIGTALVRAALDRAFSAGAVRVVVATASADIHNLRFYQRIGLRMDRMERDAFTTD